MQISRLFKKIVLKGPSSETQEGKAKDYKGGCRLASKIKDEGFEADLYLKH
jgi:hypothetical protein